MTRPLLYVIAPYATATEIEKATRLEAIRRALALGWTPIFAPFLFERAYPEETPELRAIFLECDRGIIEACQCALIVGDRRTDGMLHDIGWCVRFGVHSYLWPTLQEADSDEDDDDDEWSDEEADA